MATTREELLLEDETAKLQFAPQLAQLEQAIAEAQSGLNTAGSDVQPEIDAAEEAADGAEQDYQQYLIDLQSTIDDAGDQIEDTPEPEGATTLINSIGSVAAIDIGNINASAPSVNTGDTPDCSAAQVSAALSTAITSVNNEVNTRLNEIETKVNLSLTSLNSIITIVKNALLAHDEDLLNGAIAHLKVVGETLTEALQLQRDFTPPVVDVDALTATELDRIKNLLPG